MDIIVEILNKKNVTVGTIKLIESIQYLRCMKSIDI